MARYGPRLAAIGLMLLLLVAALRPDAGQAQSDAESFARILAGEVAGPLLAGPATASLLQEAGVLSVTMAGVNVADFVAHAAFTNPPTVEAGWDYGFQFRTTGANDDFRIFVTSEGTWNFSVGVETPQQTVVAPALDLAPGAANVLDLVVEGDQALFGINGQFVGTINLPDLSPSGDVYASTGFLADLVLPGRVIEVSEFTVSALPEQSRTAEGTPAPVDAAAPPRPVTLVTGTCEAPGEPVQALLEATYPVGERQGSPAGVVAETSFTRAPLLLTALLAEPHAIVVAESFAAPDLPLACADLGGIPDEIGGFVIALTERDGSGASGIVYLAGDDAQGQTNISVFLVPPPVAAVDGSAAATPAA